jgi:hypothetical protein
MPIENNAATPKSPVDYPMLAERIRKSRDVGNDFKLHRFEVMEMKPDSFRRMAQYPPNRDADPFITAKALNAALATVPAEDLEALAASMRKVDDLASKRPESIYDRQAASSGAVIKTILAGMLAVGGGALALHLGLGLAVGPVFTTVVAAVAIGFGVLAYVRGKEAGKPSSLRREYDASVEDFDHQVKQVLARL